MLPAFLSTLLGLASESQVKKLSRRVDDIGEKCNRAIGVLQDLKQNIEVRLSKQYQRHVLTTGIFTLAGVFVGAYATDLTQHRLRMDELRHHGYARVMGAKIPLTQTVQTILEAKILTEYHETRFQLLSKMASDREEAKYHRDRMLKLIPEFSRIQKEMFEGLGNIITVYKGDDEIRAAVDDILKYQMADIAGPPPDTIRTEEDLDSYKATALQQVERYLDREFVKKIDRLLGLLEKHQQ